MEERLDDVAHAEALPAPAQDRPVGSLRRPPRAVWYVASATILIGAALLRFYDLELRPLHHDEGVNAWFLVRLLREGVYVYDPQNYHGPTLYYAGLVGAYLLGLTTTALRVVPVVFGMGTVGLVLPFRRWIGDSGALVAAALIALSPGAIYFSRYFIHEALLVFFTLWLVYAGLRYREERRLRHLLAAAAAAALMFATKETAVISFTVLAIAVVATGVFLRLRSGARTPDRTSGSAERSSWLAAASRWGAASLLFLAVNVLLFTSFFTNASGLLDSVRTFTYWFETGQGAHVYPWYQHLGVMILLEPALLVLGICGVVSSLRARSWAAIFVALWALGISAVYSILPYKTPWLALNFLAPLAIAAGAALGSLSVVRAASATAVAAVLSLALALALNFVRYDDAAFPYVYAHTQREFLALPQEIEAIAQRVGSRDAVSISVMAPEYWPLPWYLRDFSRVGYHGQIVGTGDAVVIASAAQEAELSQILGDAYQRAGSYVLRPGVGLVLYVSNEIRP